MSESCCPTTEPGAPRVAAEPGPAGRKCPACTGEGPSVEALTVAAMARGPIAPKQLYWLCEEPDCAVVYHGDRGTVVRSEDMHVAPGFKHAAAEQLVCYCFMHTRAEIERELRSTGETTVPERITVEIKAGNCACEVRNPAGRCCLGEVKKAVAGISERLAEEGTLNRDGLEADRSTYYECS